MSASPSERDKLNVFVKGQTLEYTIGRGVTEDQLDRKKTLLTDSIGKRRLLLQ